MSQSGDSTHISQRLEVGRKYLEKLADIALQIEHAREGLTRSAFLSVDPEKLPASVKRLWESLDKDIAALPEREMIKELIELERLLTERLKTVMPMVERLCAADDRGEEVQLSGVREHLQELSRLSTTSLAIRLLAHRKRFKVPYSRLPVNADALLERAQRVKQVERKHKLRVITHMKDMVNATLSMLNAPGIDSAMRTMLKGVLRDLQTNARHIAAGGSFASMPIPIEHVEVSEEDNAEVPQEPPPAPVKVKPPIGMSPKVQTAAAPRAQPSQVTTPMQRAAVTTQRLDLTQMTPVGHFFQHMRTWLRAPVGVTWSEAGKIAHTEDSGPAKKPAISAAQNKIAAARPKAGSGEVPSRKADVSGRQPSRRP